MIQINRKFDDDYEHSKPLEGFWFRFKVIGINVAES